MPITQVTVIERFHLICHHEIQSWHISLQEIKIPPYHYIRGAFDMADTALILLQFCRLILCHVFFKISYRNFSSVIL